MNIDISAEKQLQNNTIELLKSMGYIFISQEEKVNLIHEATINIQLNLINSAIKSSIDKGLIPGGENK